jgi:hypothetical protein
MPIIGISTATSSSSMPSARDSRLLVPEHGNGPLAGDGKVSQPDGLVGQFDPDDASPGGPLCAQPPGRIPARPVHAGRAAQRVAALQGLRHPRQSRHGQAGTDGVAGAEQRAEVEAMHRPERRDDDVIPAPMSPRPALPG